MMRLFKSTFSMAAALMIGACLAALQASVVIAAEVELSLSAREAYVGMPVTAYLAVRNAEDHEPPTFPDIAGADVQAAGVPSRQSQTVIVNGRATYNSSVTYAWQITPRREGAFHIPAVTVKADGQALQTKPIEFVANKSDTGDLLFAHVAGQRPYIYVGQPITLTLKIWVKPYTDTEHSVRLSPSDMWSLVAGEQSRWGVFQKRLEELAQSRRQPEGGEVLRADERGVQRSYYLYEISTTVYPQKPGRVETGDVQVVVAYPTGLARTRDMFFSRGGLSLQGVRPIVADAAVEPIEVKPVPTEGRPEDYRGAVGRYEVQAEAVPTKVQAGDPITLHLTIRGDGPLDLVQAPLLAELETLTRDFKVPAEPLAGVVRDDVKIFTISIRPQNERVTKIPPIPFTFFDPSQERFVTVKSQPIPITVAPADTLALDSIVSAAGAASSPRPEGAQPSHVGPTLYANDTGPGLLVSQRPPSVWVVGLGLLVPPVVCGVLFLNRVRFRGDGSASRVNRAARNAKQAIKHARDPSQVSTALLGYVADRTGLPPGTLTREEAVATLREHGAQIGVEEFDRLLARCEQACYGGLATEDTAQLSATSRACIDQLHRRSWKG